MAMNINNLSEADFIALDLILKRWLDMGCLCPNILKICDPFWWNTRMLNQNEGPLKIKKG